MNADEKTPGGIGGTFQKLTRLLAAPTIEPGQRAARIQAVERDIVLPLRVLIIGILSYFFFFSGWLVTPQRGQRADHDRFTAIRTLSIRQTPSNSGRLEPESRDDTIKGYFLAYAALNVVLGHRFGLVAVSVAEKNRSAGILP